MAESWRLASCQREAYLSTFARRFQFLLEKRRRRSTVSLRGPSPAMPDRAISSVVRLQPVITVCACPRGDDSGQTCSTRDCDGESCPRAFSHGFRRAPIRNTSLLVPAGSRLRHGRVPISVASSLHSQRVEWLPSSMPPMEPAPVASGKPSRLIKRCPQRAQGPDGKRNRTAPCPSDCGGDTSPLPPDAMDIPPSGAMKSASYPASVAIDTYGSRLLISDAVGSTVTVVDFDNTKQTVRTC